MPRTAAPLAHDEDHWRAIARQFDIDPGPINLENGYFGRMTRKVAEEYQHNIQWVNRSNSVHVRQRFEQIEALQIRGQLAALLEAPENAVALTRCASDALQSLIRNYNRLQPGDQVLLSDLEYDTVKSAMRWLGIAFAGDASGAHPVLDQGPWRIGQPVTPPSLQARGEAFSPGKKKRCTDQAHRKAVEHTNESGKNFSPAETGPRPCTLESAPSRRS